MIFQPTSLVLNSSLIFVTLTPASGFAHLLCKVRSDVGGRKTLMTDRTCASGASSANAGNSGDPVKIKGCNQRIPDL